MSQSSSRSSSLVRRSPASQPSRDPCSPDVRVERPDVEPARRVQAARDVRDGDDSGPQRLQLGGGDATHVAEPLHDAALVGERPAEPVARARDHHDHACSRRFMAEDRATDRDRLAGHDLRNGVAALHRVRVHHPGHRLLVRGHVGSRDVLFRADDRQQLRRETACHALELTERHAPRVAADASFRSSVRQPKERALPRHPHRERSALAERHLRVVANPALRRPRDARVLNAVAGEDDALSAVHADGNRDDRRALRIAQALRDVVGDAGDRDGLVELRYRHAV